MFNNKKLKTMKNSFFNKLVAIALIAFFTFGYACKKKEDAPEIPPQNSLIMDFGDFNNEAKSTKDILTAANWGHSVVNVAVWNIILTFGMAVPVASFVESFNHEPKWHRRDGGYWTWEYNFSNGAHSAELTGKVDGNIVIWEMRIDDFLWYNGESATDRTSGFWVLNENASNPNELLRITWNDDHNGNADIEYLNVKPSGAENGGYIFYGKTSTGEFDRFYDIYNKGDDNLTEIEWNFADKHGRVKDPGEFGDSDWHCWDTSLQDDSCMVAK